MAFRYESGGRECVAGSIEELEKALSDGLIQRTTPVLDDTVNTRLQAGALIAMMRRGAPKPPPAAQAAPAARAPSTAAKASPFAAPKAQLDAPDEGVGTRVWVHRIVATVVAFVALVIVARITEMPPTVISTFTGPIFIVVVVAVAVTGFIFGRKNAGQRVRQAWVGMAAWTLTWLALGMWGQSLRDESAARERVAAKTLAENARKQANEMESMIGKGPQGPEAPAAAAQAAATPAAPAPASTGKGLMERLAVITAEVQAENIKELREYTAQQDSLGLENVLLPVNLTSAEGRKKGIEIIDKFLALYEAHHKRMVDRLDAYRARLAALVENDPHKAEFMTGVDKSLKTTLADYDEMRRIERAVASQMRAIIDFIAARGSLVGLKDGKIIFVSQADLDRFRQMAAAIDGLAKEEDALQQKQLARMRQSADKIDEIAQKK